MESFRVIAEHSLTDYVFTHELLLRKNGPHNMVRLPTRVVVSAALRTRFLLFQPILNAAPTVQMPAFVTLREMFVYNVKADRTYEIGD